MIRTTLLQFSILLLFLPLSFFTDMWDVIILTGRHSLLSFEIFEDLQHTYSWMKYYNKELDVNQRDEGVLKDLLNEVTKSIDQSLKNLAIADK